MTPFATPVVGRPAVRPGLPDAGDHGVLVNVDPAAARVDQRQRRLGRRGRRRPHHAPPRVNGSCRRGRAEAAPSKRNSLFYAVTRTPRRCGRAAGAAISGSWGDGRAKLCVGFERNDANRRRPRPPPPPAAGRMLPGRAGAAQGFHHLRVRLPPHDNSVAGHATREPTWEYSRCGRDAGRSTAAAGYPAPGPPKYGLVRKVSACRSK